MTNEDNLHQLLLEHNACEWLDRVQDYFSQQNAALTEAEAEIAEWKATANKEMQMRDQYVKERDEALLECEALNKIILVFGEALQRRNARLATAVEALEQISWSWANDAGRACDELAKDALAKIRGT